MTAANKQSIVFAGTPDLAATMLLALIQADYSIKAVYTQPDRPAGRGRRLTPSAVKQVAAAHDLPIFQPERLKNNQQEQQLRELAPDLMLVVAYGLIIPESILAIPRLGCVNAHVSLLPRWRGAAPIQHAILHGDRETGVTLMQMDAGLDTGPILSQEFCPIYPTDTSANLHDRLALLGADLLLKDLPNFFAGELTPTPQDDHQSSYASKINKLDAKLDWRLPAGQLLRAIRAYNPWPIAYSVLNEQKIRVWDAEVIPGGVDDDCLPGTILAADSAGMAVATGEGVLRLLRVQLPGGKEMAIQSMLNARREQFAPGNCFDLN